MTSRGVPIIEVERPSSRVITVDAHKIGVSTNISIVTSASRFAETNCACRMAMAVFSPRLSAIPGATWQACDQRVSIFTTGGDGAVDEEQLRAPISKRPDNTVVTDNAVVGKRVVWEVATHPK